VAGCARYIFVILASSVQGMRSDNAPLNQPLGWGSIDEVLSEPPQNVAPDSSWCAVIGFWLTWPLNLIQGIFGGLCACIYRSWSFSNCCCTIYDSVVKGRPCYMAWVWWRYFIGALVALVRFGRSRLALFIWEKEACGGGEYFWQGEGIWATSYAVNSEIMQSQQDRTTAFACIRACVPDLFASGLLIFLPCAPQWASIRAALHTTLLDWDRGSYKDRLQELPQKIREAWPAPKLEDLNDKALLQRTVCKSILFMVFGVWITDDEAEVLRGWRTNASIFVLPRIVQRIMFNRGINKVKTLRKKTVEIIERHGLQDLFVTMNASLPSEYRREPIVRLCDEIMYVIGFAGIGGSCACVESVSQFIQLKTGEVPQDKVDFAKYPAVADMVAAYKANPENYIKETARLDPPVTSATSVVKQDMLVEMGFTGKSLFIAAGFLRQYTLSLANRDPTVFENPSLFDPTRPSLERALTWNGEISKGEQAYPRLCPGRYLSLQVVQAIMDHGISSILVTP